MNILYTAFNGKNNSSKVLLDKIIAPHKLYLKNSFTTSITQLEKTLKKNNYDLIISFGESKIDYDTIKLELTAKIDISYSTNYDYTNLKEVLSQNNYNVMISNNAGNYLCNNIYFYGLKYINENNLNTKMLFIHIPKLNKITDINKLANILNELFKSKPLV